MGMTCSGGLKNHIRAKLLREAGQCADNIREGVNQRNSKDAHRL
jgi:hypothetical protein